jgi:hypothetical protein
MVPLLSLLLPILLIVVSCAQSKPMAIDSDSAEQRLWPDNKLPQVVNDPDNRSVEVGTEFTTASDGMITAVRFYQGPDNTGADQATLWSSEGTQIAAVSIPPGPAGWREIPFHEPVPVKADRTYVISYQASKGHYSTDSDTFAGGRKVKSAWLTALGGVFAEGDGFPAQPSNGTNYYVDVAFKPTGPSLRTVDGGNNYFDRFKNSFPTSPDFFPLGVWYTRTTSPQDIASDRALGINTYVMLTADSDVQLIKDSGMFAIADKPNPYAAGQLLTDEADMWSGPGDAQWTGGMAHDAPNCIPEDAHCGYTALRKLREQVPPGVLAYANYGKGVTFWQSRDEAERFVNDFQDLVSVDNYWFTDAAICGVYQGGVRKNGGVAPLSPEDCHIAANYGMTTRYVRSLVQPRGAIPVWNFVEVGYLTSDDGERLTITGPQIRAAVWSSIINGARGIIYFVHNFGGPCPSNNTLRDQCGDANRADLIAVNQQIGRLAPVLNAPFLDGYARSDGPVDLAAKRYEGENYVLVGSTTNEPSEVRIVLSCGNATSAEVIDENRTVPIADRSFEDTFGDSNAVHLYKINGDGCRLA